MRRGITAVITALAATLVGLAAPTHAADIWGMPITVSELQKNTLQAQTAFAKNGTRGVAVWGQFNGTHVIVHAAVAQVSGDSVVWGSPLAISEIGQNAETPQVAISADGTRVTAVWVRSDGTNKIVQSRSATIQGIATTWGQVTDLTPTGANAVSPVLALSDAGDDAAATWVRDGRVQARALTITGTTASPGVTTIISATGGRNPRLAMAADGSRATAVWSLDVGVAGSVAQTRSARVNGNAASWGDLTELTESSSGPGGTTGTFRPRVAVSDDGTAATAVWVFGVGSGVTIQSRSAAILGDGKVAQWGATHDVAADPGTLNPDVDLSADGRRAVAVWHRDTASGDVVQANSAAVSGTEAEWGTPSVLSELESRTNQSPMGTDVAVSDDGRVAVATWRGEASPNEVIRSATGSLDGPRNAWSAPLTIFSGSLDVTAPLVGLTADGSSALAVWTQSSGNDYRVRSAAGVIDARPVFGASTSALAFPEREVGSASPGQSITVTNTGQGTMLFPTPAAQLQGGNAADFRVAADTCSSAALRSGQSCTVTVEFLPQAAGPRSAELAIADSAAGAPHIIALTGAAKVAPVALKVDARRATRVLKARRSNVVVKKVTSPGQVATRAICRTKAGKRQSCAVRTTGSGRTRVTPRCTTRKVAVTVTARKSGFADATFQRTWRVVRGKRC